MGQRLSIEQIDRIMQSEMFTCRYCGYAGDTLNGWMQLSIDHILPINSGGSDEDANLTTCCNHCNSITASMRFSKMDKTDFIISAKKLVVSEHLNSVKDRWMMLSKKKRLT